MEIGRCQSIYVISIEMASRWRVSERERIEEKGFARETLISALFARSLITSVVTETIIKKKASNQSIKYIVFQNDEWLQPLLQRQYMSESLIILAVAIPRKRAIIMVL
jgi:hypothetical protein